MDLHQSEIDQRLRRGLQERDRPRRLGHSPSSGPSSIVVHRWVDGTGQVYRTSRRYFFHLMFLGRQVPKLKQARLASPKVRTPKPTKVALSEPYLVIEWVHLSDSPPVAEVIGAEGRQTQRENAHSRRLDPKSVYTTGCHGVKADSRTRQMFLRWTQVRR